MGEVIHKFAIGAGVIAGQHPADGRLEVPAAGQDAQQAILAIIIDICKILVFHRLSLYLSSGSGMTVSRYRNVVAAQALVLDVQLQEVGSVYLDQAVDAIKNERAQALRRYRWMGRKSQDGSDG